MEEPSNNPRKIPTYRLKRIIIGTLIVLGVGLYYLYTPTISNQTPRVQAGENVELSITWKLVLGRVFFHRNEFSVLNEDQQNKYVTLENFLEQAGISPQEFLRFDYSIETAAAYGQKISTQLPKTPGVMHADIYAWLKNYEQDLKISKRVPFYTEDVCSGSFSTGEPPSNKIWKEETSFSVLPKTPPGKYTLRITPEDFCGSGGPSGKITFVVIN